MILLAQTKTRHGQINKSMFFLKKKVSTGRGGRVESVTLVTSPGLDGNGE